MPVERVSNARRGERSGDDSVVVERGVSTVSVDGGWM